MKHNNSNQSISGKKFVGTVKNQGPGGVPAGVVMQGVTNNNNKKNYMSPYS